MMYTGLLLLLAGAAAIIVFGLYRAMPIILAATTTTATRQTEAIEQQRDFKIHHLNKCVANPSGTDTGIDIIAIHGLDTTSKETWTWKDPRDLENREMWVNWLADEHMLPAEVPGTRIFACDWPAKLFEAKDSVPFKIEELAASLRQCILELNPRGDRQILFIASCLGGVILMQALAEAKDQYATIREATRGIIFLATPFRGTSFQDVALWAQPGLQAWASIRDQQLTELLEWVKSSEFGLVYLVGEFTRICVNPNNEGLKVITFYEKRHSRLFAKVPFSSWLLPSGKKVLVDMDSATLDCVPDRIALDRPHVMMNKFRGPKDTDPHYGTVVRNIQDLLAKIQTGTTLEQADNWIRKEHYTPEKLNIMRLSGDLLDKGQSYINLVIVEQIDLSTSAQNRSKEENSAPRSSPFSLLARQKVELPEENAQLRLADIFNQRKRSDGTEILPRKILIRGRAGVGKTTLCKKLVHDFMENKMWNSLFDRVLWIPLRNLKQQASPGYDLTTLLRHEFFRFSEEDSKRFAKELCTALVRERTLFVLDGWDEVAEQGKGDDIFSELLSQSNIIVTSRPSATLPHGINIDLELETIGFSPAQVDEYIDKVHGKKVDEIKAFLRTHELVQSLVRIPIQLDAFCYCWDDIGSECNQKPNTMTSLYQAINSSLWKKDIIRLEKMFRGKYITEKLLSDNFQTFIELHVKDELRFLEHLAFSGLVAGKVEFGFGDWQNARRHSELQFAPNDSLPRLSFIRTSNQSAKTEHQSYHFIHLTFQEYFAARFFVRHWERKEDREMKYTVFGQKSVETISPVGFLRQHKYATGYDIMWRFVAGLLDEQDRSFELLSEIERESSDLLGPSHQRLIMHCLSEVALTGSQPHRNDFEQRLSDWLLFEYSLTKRAGLARENEFPDNSLQIAFQQGSIEVKSAILKSIERRTWSNEISDTIGCFIGQNDDKLRHETIKAMQYQSALSMKTVDVLVGLLKDTDHDTSQILRVLLNQSNLSDAHSELLAQEVYGHLDSWSEATCDFFSNIFHKSPGCASFAKAFVRCLNSTTPQKSTGGYRAIAGLRNLPEAVIEFIGEQLKDSEADVSALKALQRQRALPQAMDASIKKLKDPEYIVRGEALRVLKKENQSALPQATVEVIVECMNDDVWYVRETALDVLADQSVLSKAIVDAIAKKLADKNAYVRRAAVRALGAQSPLPKSIHQTISGLRTDEDNNVRRAVQDVLKQPVLPRVLIDAIIQRMEDTAESSHRAIESILEDQTNLPKMAFDIITQRIRVAGTEIRQATIKALLSQPVLPKAVIKDMNEQLNGTDPDIRKTILKALMPRSKLPEETVVATTEQLEDPEFAIREAALRALRHQPVLPYPTVVAITEQLEDPELAIWEAALQALENQPALPHPTIEAIIKRGGAAGDYTQWEIRRILERQPLFFEVATNMFATRVGADEGTRQHLESTTHSFDQILRFLCKILLEQSFEESLSYYTHKDIVWVDNGSGQLKFDFSHNPNMVHQIRSAIIASRPEGYPSHDPVWKKSHVVE
ncbi:hypothetical protein PFICI_10004 [Pestalotiopsis fici W106-1]|uniref:NACHT domain-containing protein n=1 Tax=Pestalotiopsis fici (strain W106-1 / CGMCC3.15140) TaxID=1229662 RepID=W3WXT1_PESFW|nr:uncharacterized protein PFICI_10004 [Pestalotiopsis fici W106-1]ETS77942.1 hypothetical protein PFICI_10004 [Pestalotiopsis fici W106-1]